MNFDNIDISAADFFTKWMMFIKSPESIPFDCFNSSEIGKAIEVLNSLNKDSIMKAYDEARQI